MSGSNFNLTTAKPVSSYGNLDGVINYIGNGRAEVDTAGWVTYNDGAVANPIDGIGGSLSGLNLFGISASSAIRGAYSFRFTKAAASNCQGQGFSYDFNIDNADKGVGLSLTCEFTPTNGYNSDVSVFVLDKTNNILTPVQNSAALNGGIGIVNKFYGLFNTSINSTSYRLIFHITTASTTLWNLIVDSVTISPQGVALGTTTASPSVAGIVHPYSGLTEPTGWKFCYGQAISRTVFADLFGALGTTYGVGDGSTTFNVPDLRGRAVFGRDDMGGSAASRITASGSSITGTTLGASGGVETVTLNVGHLPGHTHNYSGTTSGFSNDHSHSGNTGGQSSSTSHDSAAGRNVHIGSSGGQYGVVDSGNVGSSGQLISDSHSHSFSTGGASSNHSHTYSGTTDNGTGSGGALQNMPPTAILNYIVKLYNDQPVTVSANTDTRPVGATFSGAAGNVNADGGLHALVFNSVVIDTVSGFSAGQYIVQSPGYYWVSCAARINDGPIHQSNANTTLLFYVNGVEKGRAAAGMAQDNEPTALISKLFYLNATDVLSASYYTSSTLSGSTGWDANGTYLSLVKVNTPSTSFPLVSSFMAGMMMPFGGTVSPVGWVTCDGSNYDGTQATYGPLWLAIGLTWGGTGQSSFKVPDLRRRTLIGSGGTGTGTIGNAVGNIGGEESHQLTVTEMPSHNHSGATNTDGSHQHAISTRINGALNGGPANNDFVMREGAAGTNGSGTINAAGSNHNHGIQSQGGDGAHNVMQPSAVALWIIKL